MILLFLSLLEGIRKFFTLIELLIVKYFSNYRQKIFSQSSFLLNKNDHKDLFHIWNRPQNTLLHIIMETTKFQVLIVTIQTAGWKLARIIEHSRKRCFRTKMFISPQNLTPDNQKGKKP